MKNTDVLEKISTHYINENQMFSYIKKLMRKDEGLRDSLFLFCKKHEETTPQKLASILFETNAENVSRLYISMLVGANADLVNRAIESGVKDNVVGPYLYTLLGHSTYLEVMDQLTILSGEVPSVALSFQACMMVRNILLGTSSPLLAREMRKVIKRFTGDEDPIISDGEGELCLQLQIFQILDDCNNGATMVTALGFNQILKTLANVPAVPFPLESSDIVPNKEETILEDPEKDKGKGKGKATKSVVPNPRFLLEQGYEELNRLCAFLREEEDNGPDNGNPGTSSQVAPR